MAQIWNWTWLTVAFLSELAALAALALWGWSAGASTGTKLLLAVAAPAVAGVLWGVFAAPLLATTGPLAAAGSRSARLACWAGAALAAARFSAALSRS